MPTALASEVLLRARSVGPAVAPSLARPLAELRVHSVFSSIANLEIEGGDILVALSPPAGAAYPHAVALEEGDFRRLRRLAVGEAGLLDRSLIRFKGLAVELRGVETRPRLELPRLTALGSAYRAGYAALGRFQAAIGSELRLDALEPADGCCGRALGAADGPMARALRRAALALGEAASAYRQDGDRLGPAVLGLLGRGGGLTPSGDDFLCGFMAAARCAVHPDEGLVEALAGAVEANLDRTTDISASLLRCAARAQWPLPLARLAIAMAEERESEAIRAIDELCAFGHSSGADIATGFLYGLRAMGALGRETTDVRTAITRS